MVASRFVFLCVSYHFRWELANTWMTRSGTYLPSWQRAKIFIRQNCSTLVDFQHFGFLAAGWQWQYSLENSVEREVTTLASKNLKQKPIKSKFPINSRSVLFPFLICQHPIYLRFRGMIIKVTVKLWKLIYLFPGNPSRETLIQPVRRELDPQPGPSHRVMETKQKMELYVTSVSQ